jgi:hypothetical protein
LRPLEVALVGGLESLEQNLHELRIREEDRLEVSVSSFHQPEARQLPVVVDLVEASELLKWDQLEFEIQEADLLEAWGFWAVLQ